MSDPNYFEVSTIHGFSYLTKKFHWIEKIFWIISLIFALFCTTFLISDVANKIKNFPIVIYLSDHGVPVSEINFPAVSICAGQSMIFEGHDPERMFPNHAPFVPFERHKIFAKLNYTKEELKEYLEDDFKFNLSYPMMLDKIERDEIKIEDIPVRLLKRLQVIDIFSKRGVFLNKNINLPTDDFLDVVLEFDKALWSIFEIFSFWQSRHFVNYSEILTEFGLCYTTNIAKSSEVLNLQETSNDFHYTFVTLAIEDENIKVVNDSQTPKRTLSSQLGILGVANYFRLGTEYRPHDEVINMEIDGFYLLIHDPYELPSTGSFKIPINGDKKLNIWIESELHNIDESLVDFTSQDRNCFLESEKSLKFFKVYTKINCELECLTDFMIKACKCVEFFMIRNSSTRICTASEQNCYEKAKRDFDLNYKSSCGCLEPCDYVNYKFKIVDQIYHNFISSDIGYSSPYKVKITYNIKMISDSFNRLIRKKQFDQIDFISYSGGLLGLFTGFSLLSAFELIYWILMRRKIIEKSSTRVYPINENEGSKNIVENYLEESSIHGFYYFTQKHKFERLIWLIAFLTSITFCGIFISKVNSKVPNSRVMAFDDISSFNDEIIFPAITFYPDLYHPKLIYILDEFDGGENEFFDLVKNESFINNEMSNLGTYCLCDNDWRFSIKKKLFNVISFMNLPSIAKETSEIEWFKNQSATWNEKFKPKFTEIWTTRGIGYTFNLMSPEEILNFDEVDSSLNYPINITLNYPQDIEIKSSSNPLKVNLKDRSAFKLTFKELKKDPKDFGKCLMPSFHIHQPDEIPSFIPRTVNIEIKNGMTINAIVTPEIVRTDKNLKHLSPHDRECFFEGERKLKYFKKYSRKNCEIECFTNYTMDFCNCTSFEQPFNFAKNIKHCPRESDFGLLTCAEEIQRRILASEDFSFEKNCSCLESCDSITYHVTYITEDHDGDESIIIVRMNTDEMILYRRYQQFTVSDVISYVGGLLGLFAGISVLSLFEVFYFFVVRVISGMCREETSFNN